ncbi:MAG: hypothetical protein JSS04_10995 [Proteobacteria bacterium]|nr:hypothetical protein [Pseudomonadota bacterium]
MPNNNAALEETTTLTSRAAAKSLVLAAPFLSASAPAATGRARVGAVDGEQLQ